MRPIILLVEDDHDIAEVMVMALTENGYEVVCASDGVEGLDSLHAEPHPDVVLVDLMMPDLDGWGFLRAKRQDGDVAAIPVLAMTALTMSGATAGDLDGSAGLLMKPFDLDALLGAVSAFAPAA